MNLKKLMIVEGVVVAVVLIAVLAVVGIIPYLESANQNASIAMYSEREFGSGNLTLSRGMMGSSQFNYTTFDPAILVIDLNFQNWKSPGMLTLACNGRVFASVYASPDKPQISLGAITMSGADLVKPKSYDSFVFGNEITFTSESSNGYEGSFSYQIKIRGSR